MEGGAIRIGIKSGRWSDKPKRRTSMVVSLKAQILRMKLSNRRPIRGPSSVGY